LSLQVVTPAVLSVSEYSSLLGRALREVGAAVLEGEVQKAQWRPNGMVYFDLTDGDSVLSCKVFRNDAPRLEHRPRDGDLVRVRVDRPDLWAARGALSLIVSQVALAGGGELLRRRAELIAALTQEGLCDPARRRPLPRFPRAVGVIAGAGSDGMSDVLRALQDRWPAVNVVTCPSLVQGRTASRQLIDALARLQEHPRVDVIVLARGGGSVQDLACFDDERLCRALFACDVPVVCAIGHTDNNPVCNHVAWPAFTPSRSAELVVPSAAELRRELDRAGERLDAAQSRLALAGERVRATAARIDSGRVMELRAAAIHAPTARIAGALRDFLNVQPRIGDLGERIQQRVRQRTAQAARDLVHRGELIAARDFRPRGWLLASAGGQTVRSVASLTPGEPIELHLHDGRAEVRVERLHPDDPRSDQ
jgi:exodeoxyribonuclease VII large subunit